MTKKYRTFTITTDKDMSGLGYSRLQDTTCNIHCLVLFIFIFTWATPRRHGKIEIAKFVHSNCVSIGDKTYDLFYYGDVEHLTHIYYRNSLGTWLKTNDFYQLGNDMFALSDETQGKWIVLSDRDVCIFNPNNKVEGFIYRSCFYATKELSVG
jgi:hypothetical protein